MKIKKEKIEELKEKMQKEKEFIGQILNDFAKRNKALSWDWDTRYPNFKTEGDPEEEADEVEEYSSLLSVENTLETKIQNINKALEKIKKGNYGKCEVCKNDIQQDILELTPETKTCSDCKNHGTRNT